jgi:hypothetical protein
MPDLILHCPQCPDIRQGTRVTLAKLKEMLHSGEVSVIGGVCGHSWNLSAEELKGLRAAVAAGAFE